MKFRFPEARAGGRHLGYGWLQSIQAGIGLACKSADAGKKAQNESPSTSTSRKFD